MPPSKLASWNLHAASHRLNQVSLQQYIPGAQRNDHQPHERTNDRIYNIPRWQALETWSGRPLRILDWLELARPKRAMAITDHTKHRCSKSWCHTKLVVALLQICFVLFVFLLGDLLFAIALAVRCCIDDVTWSVKISQDFSGSLRIYKVLYGSRRISKRLLAYLRISQAHGP